jgi:hypothetical protein
MPALADPESVPAAEQDDFARVLAYVHKYTEGNPVADARPYVDGAPYAKSYWSAWTNAPRACATLVDAGYALNDNAGKPGHFSAADHEMIDLVLGFDSGYWAFHAGHTANAVVSGIRVEAIEALADGRESELTDDERLQVAFIRAVRDCAMTDELWDRVVERQGSLRGTIELAYFVCTLLSHHRMMSVFGVPAIDERGWRETLESYKGGAVDPAAATQDYVFPTLDRG